MDKHKLINFLQWCGLILLIVLIVAFAIACKIFYPVLEAWLIKNFVF